VSDEREEHQKRMDLLFDSVDGLDSNTAVEYAGILIANLARRALRETGNPGQVALLAGVIKFTTSLHAEAVKHHGHKGQNPTDKPKRPAKPAKSEE
jgi:hypothetical protein